MAGEDPGHLAWVRGQRCCARALSPCRGPVQAHHHRDMTGLALRPPDAHAVPLCDGHHDQLHDGGPAFDGWGKDQRRAWFWDQVHDTQARRARALACTWF